MLRTAVKLLLALVLVLNGFLMPVAKAAHNTASAAHAAHAAASCHDGMAGASMPPAPSHAARVGGKNALGKHAASCCDHGGCDCGCITSIVTPDIVAAIRAFAPVVRMITIASSPLPATRYSVALRPPIA